MKYLNRSIVVSCLAAAVCLLPQAALAQPNPRIGTWKLDVAKPVDRRFRREKTSDFGPRGCHSIVHAKQYDLHSHPIFEHHGGKCLGQLLGFWRFHDKILDRLSDGHRRIERRRHGFHARISNRNDDRDVDGG